MVTIKVITEDDKTEEIVVIGKEDYADLLEYYGVRSIQNLSGRIVFYSSLNDGETYTLGVPKKHNDGAQSMVDVDLAKWVRGAILTPENIEPESYLKVAEKFRDDKEQRTKANKVLAEIEGLYKIKWDDHIAPMVCIFDSSGTGKTQLAPTTALLRPNDTVVYLYAGNSSYDLAQDFYKPHWHLWQKLRKHLNDFSINHINNRRSSELPGAGIMLATQKKHLLNRIIRNILLPEATVGGDLTTKDLRAMIDKKKEEQKPRNFFVFVDEIPPGKDNQNFEGLVLRNFLRAIGVVPVLMSTHSGSHNAIPGGSDSRTGYFPAVWCRVITNLPLCNNNRFGYMYPTERPLVATISSGKGNSNLDLDHCVRMIREYLYSTKTSAWTVSPIFQLCQLFRSTKDEKNRILCSHRLVGEHFGHFEHSNGKIDIFRSQPKLKGKIRMPEAEREPLLFLALTSWWKEDLKINPTHFPLQNTKGDAISVRQAFEACKDEFMSDVFLDNPEAMQNDGRLMELLALASITLASLRADDGILMGVRLVKFISTFFCLMLKTFQIDFASDLESWETRLNEFVNNNPDMPYTDLKIPAVPSSDSRFPSKLFRQGQIQGTLKRQANSERCDGLVAEVETGSQDQRQSANAGIVQVECKNYRNGLDTDTLQNVITRMTVGVKVTFLFTSKLNGVWKSDSKMDDFFQSVGVTEGDMCLLYLTSGEEIKWVQTLNGVTLKPLSNCQYLLVIFGVDAVDAVDAMDVGA